ncbi:glycosyltransferase [Wohlfahrtiimonas chitiniclastica]|uniref:glycosyltransferase n=1 Tax=Wohlfahrtiimonas chitiniclastica TaxID=400946 RepID=UPI000B98820E|nr:glycosyltransferase [Wohlfahrtiimonas chitiniclastica]OYQ74961.1 hypothetical protein B9T18_06910 [Wohlfahrtiimonas chitiniclastica]
MKKISIIIDTLITGGAHRVALMHAQMLQKIGYNVELVLLVEPVNCNLDIPKDLTITSLIKHTHIKEQSSLWSKIKRHLSYTPLLSSYLKNSQSDLVFSHIQGVNSHAIIASYINKIPVIAAEHTTHKLPSGYKRLIAIIERKLIYKLANCITVLTKTEFNYYSKFLKKVKILPNPISFPILSEKEVNTLFPKRNKTILAVGDLNRIHIKGWDNLLQVFQQILIIHPEWKLVMAGPSENNVGLNTLKEQAKELGIINAIDFIGARKDIKKEYQKAGLFVLTSRNEGLPLVLLEAMSQGCPVISFNCISGPSEIIKSNIDGILVSNQNKDEMIKKVISLINEPDSRLKMSLNAVKNAQRFSIDQIQIKLNNIIQEILEDK